MISRLATSWKSYNLVFALISIRNIRPYPRAKIFKQWGRIAAVCFFLDKKIQKIKDCIKPVNLYTFCVGGPHFNIRVCWNVFQNTPKELSFFS